VLLTPYDGGNLGDAVIQDAVIANIRVRLPGVQFSGISLSCQNFKQRHGANAFPLCTGDRAFYAMARSLAPAEILDEETSSRSPGRKSLNKNQVKQALKGVPLLGWLARSIYRATAHVWGELAHCVRAYRFLRGQDLVIVSGGGQLDEEWGGAWGHPFALLKWAILARMRGIPFVLASVGACKVTSTTARFFFSIALRMARYRSYRDENSREIATGLLQRAASDSVVPDLAFSMPSSELPASAGIRSAAHRQKVVAISPIIYAKPGGWPSSDRGVYDRYVREMVRVASQLLKRDYFLVIIWSSSDDRSAITEILERLDPDSKNRVSEQVSVASITTWKDVLAALLDVDFVIASRLHSAILGFLAQKPTLAVSFDPKVDWLMQDVGQSDYLLRIRDFTAEDVIETLQRLELRGATIMDQIGSYRARIAPSFGPQYDSLADYAMASYRSRS